MYLVSTSLGLLQGFWSFSKCFLSNIYDKQLISELTNRIYFFSYLFRKFSEYPLYPGTGHWGYNDEKYSQYFLSRL